MGNPKNNSNFKEDLRKQNYKSKKAECIVTHSNKQNCYLDLMIDFKDEELVANLLNELEISDLLGANELRIYISDIQVRMQKEDALEEERQKQE